MQAGERELAVERRLSAIETRVEALRSRDTEILQVLNDLKKSHTELATKIDRYQTGAKFVFGVGMTIGGFLWFLWRNFSGWSEGN